MQRNFSPLFHGFIVSVMYCKAMRHCERSMESGVAGMRSLVVSPTLPTILASQLHHRTCPTVSGHVLCSQDIAEVILPCLMSIESVIGQSPSDVFCNGATSTHITHGHVRYGLGQGHDKPTNGKNMIPMCFWVTLWIVMILIFLQLSEGLWPCMHDHVTMWPDLQCVSSPVTISCSPRYFIVNLSSPWGRCRFIPSPTNLWKGVTRTRDTSMRTRGRTLYEGSWKVLVDQSAAASTQHIFGVRRSKTGRTVVWTAFRWKDGWSAYTAHCVFGARSVYEAASRLGDTTLTLITRTTIPGSRDDGHAEIFEL